MFAVVGINHSSSSLKDREYLEPGKSKLPAVLHYLSCIDQVSEVLVLNTCNRLEYYLTVTESTDIVRLLKDFYLNFLGKDIQNQIHNFYIKQNKEAIRHLFNVISGLDSLIKGEYQIQGQIKDAYSMACAEKTIDAYMHKLFHAAFRCGKNVRSQTNIGSGRQSVSGVAAGIMIEKCRKDDATAIIGINENSRIIASELKRAGFNNFIFVNRTLHKAAAFADEFGGTAEPLSRIMHVLSNVKAVYTSTGAPGLIANSSIFHSLIKLGSCPEIIIDMAVPRDFSTDGLPDYIQHFDLAALKIYLETQNQKYSEDLPKANSIIESEVSIFLEWSEFKGSDLIKPFAEKFEIIRQQILEEFSSQFSENSLVNADKLSRQLIHRLQGTIVSIIKKNID